MDSRELKLLVIDDNPDDAFLLVYELKRAGYQVFHEVACTEREVRALLLENEWDCITSDHKMPEFSAPQAVTLVRELVPDMPLVIVSGELDIDLAVSLLKSGADDYVQKRDLPLVVKAVESAIERSLIRAEQSKETAKNRERERLLRSYFDLPIVGAMILDRDGAVVEVNDTLCELLGYARAQLLGPLKADLAYPDDLDHLRCRMQDLRNRRTTMFETDARLVRQDGKAVPVRLSGNYIYSEADGVEHLLLLVIDQTQQKKLAAEAEDRGNMLAAIDHTSPFAMYLFNVKTLGFTYANANAQKAFGFDEDELIAMGGKIWDIVADPEDLKAFASYQQAIAKTPDNVTISSHFKIKDKDGVFKHYICHESVYQRDEDGLPEILFGVQSEITGLMDAQNQLNEKNLRLNAIVSAVEEGVCSVSKDGSIIATNKAFADMLGTACDALTGTDFYSLICGACLDAFKEHVDKWQAGRQVDTKLSVEYVRADGSSFQSETALHCIQMGSSSECLAIVKPPR